jgi:hypothetical protein
MRRTVGQAEENDDLPAVNDDSSVLKEGRILKE